MMRDLAERVYFLLCRALGWLLRSARYSKVRVVGRDEARKRRAFFAPLLIVMSGPLLKILNTGVRVLRQRDWEDRERLIHQRLRGTSIRIDAGGVLVLPYLPGETLATVLEDPAGEESVKKTAIERAVVALAEFHRLGFTHGDAMAENVLIDSSKRAHWFDFETMHDPSRPVDWRRADDLRALAVTCVIRTDPEKVAETLQLILDVYDDDEVTRVLATTFNSGWRRPLAFHLAQAGLSFQSFREIARLLARSAGHL